ncbi:hypothetical protein [Kribbella voronezhensis]|nr:hypothetical protein [Kribbella voronezhensis]
MYREAAGQCMGALPERFDVAAGFAENLQEHLDLHSSKRIHAQQ